MKRQLDIFFTGLCLLMFVGACSVTGPLRVDPKALNYETGSLPASWQRRGDDQKESSADQIYSNAKTNAYIAINSMCQRYPDSSLESLMRQLMVPISQSEVSDQHTRMIDEREALQTSVKGLLDGVAVEAQFLVLRKNECIFDFSLISRGHLNSEDLAAFEKMVSGFHYFGGVSKP